MSEIRDRVREKIEAIIKGCIDYDIYTEEINFDLDGIDKILSIPEIAVISCLRCPKCGKIISEEEVKCQLSDKLQEERK